MDNIDTPRYITALYQHHADSLAESCIDIAASTRNKLSSMSARAATDAAFGNDAPTVAGDAICIPYHNLDGSQMIGDDGIAYSRFRIFDNRVLAKGEKPMRYMGRPCSGVRPYLPIGVAQTVSQNQGFPLLATEGEKKALAANAAGLPCVGISGVTMWSSRGDSGVPLSEDSPVHEEIIALAKQAGSAVVAADSDATKNPQVRKMMSLFADALRKQAGVPVAYIAIPAPSSENKDAKRGLDDWLYELNGNTRKIRQFVEYAIKNEISKTETLSSGGWHPLGYMGEANVVWSTARGCVVSLSAASASNPATLINVVGGRDWCEAAYGRAGKDGETSINWQSFHSDIVSRCIEKGVFDMQNQRGAGVWRDADGTLIINDGEGIWTPSGRTVSRVTKKFVYPVSKRLGIRPETVPASVSESTAVYDALRTWNWQKDSDALLMLGWIALCYLSGALSWRPHVSLTGSASTGKSKLQEFITRLLGAGVISRNGADTSEAGIRQEIKCDATCVILDESESNGRKVAALLTLLRSASDDKTTSKGTAGGEGVRYTMRCCGMVAGIVPPTLEPADATRFVRFELAKMSDEQKTNPHFLVDTNVNLEDGTDETEVLGRRLCARMIGSWSRFTKAQEILREKLDGTTRFRDSLCPILSASWCLLHDEDLTEEAADALVKSVDTAEQSARMATDAKDEQEAFNHLLAMPARIQTDTSTESMTIADACRYAFAECKSGTAVTPYTRALGLLGMRLVADIDNLDTPVMMISPKSPGFKNLFKDTKWASGDIGTVLRRIDGATPKVFHKSIRIGGVPCRPTCIDMSSYIETFVQEVEAKPKTAIAKYM